jgi:uncharacterized membrane protein YbhN (UPF0104 family)
VISVRPNTRRFLIGLLQIVVSLLLIVWAAASVGSGELIAVMKGIPILVILVSVVGILGVALLQAIRWRHILDYLGGALPSERSALIVLLSLLYNQVLPSTVGGDAVRVWMARDAAPTIAIVVKSVLVDRIVGLAALALVAAVAWPFLFRDVGWDPAVVGAGLISFGGLAATIGLFLFSLLPVGSMALTPLRLAWGLAHSLRTSLLPVRRSLLVGGLGVLGHGGVLMVTWLLGWGIELGAHWSAYAVVVPPVLIVSVLPISVAGWGVREGAMVAGFGLLGVASEKALALSILFGAVGTAAGLVGGAIWLLARLRTTAIGSRNGGAEV